MKALSNSVTAALVVCLFALPADAQQRRANPAAKPSTAAKADKVIRAGSAAFVKAFNAGDAKRDAALWTQDGDYIDETGQASRGRAAIEKQYSAFFKQNPGASIRVDIQSIRVLNVHTAIEDGVAKLDALAGGQVTRSRYTAVHTLTAGKWLMSSVRDASLATPGNHARLAKLAWLIGTWHAEHQGVELEMTFRWLPNRSFIQRDFKVTKRDRVLLSGQQIIGWDPIEERISSWLFDSTGSYAVGAWAPSASGWVVRSTGVSSDGLWTRATNVLSSLHGRLVWKSIKRGASKFDLLDSEEIILKRK
jgi:uncharacterized protein (TIGR02246 family)